MIYYRKPFFNYRKLQQEKAVLVGVRAVFKNYYRKHPYFSELL